MLWKECNEEEEEKRRKTEESPPDREAAKVACSFPPGPDVMCVAEVCG